MHFIQYQITCSTMIQIPLKGGANYWLSDLVRWHCCLLQSSLVQFSRVCIHVFLLSKLGRGGNLYGIYMVQPSVTASAVCVNDPVPLQMVHQDEGFSTQCAAIRPLPAVCALVDPQAALLREPLPTLSTTVRLLTRVCPVVDAEVGRTLEVFAAHRAPESPLSLVALVVQLELVQTAKCLPTLRTDIAPCHSRQRFLCWETCWSESSVWR